MLFRVRDIICFSSLCILSVLLLKVFMIYGCKGKEERQTIEASAVTEKQSETVDTENVYSSESSNPMRQPIKTNAPPRITRFDVEPITPVVGDTVKIILETCDRDEDNVKVLYQWAKNDVLLDITSNTLLLSDGFKRGDKISIKATPADGNIMGAPLTMVVHIANASPVLKSLSERVKLNGNQYFDQIQAVDPDRDPLTFTLKNAPDGMTIDPDKGSVRWNVPSQFAGTFRYTISVTDGHGGETEANIEIDLNSKLREGKP